MYHFVDTDSKQDCNTKFVRFLPRSREMSPENTRTIVKRVHNFFFGGGGFFSRWGGCCCSPAGLGLPHCSHSKEEQCQRGGGGMIPALEEASCILQSASPSLCCQGEANCRSRKPPVGSGSPHSSWASRRLTASAAGHVTRGGWGWLHTVNCTQSAPATPGHDGLQKQLALGTMGHMTHGGHETWGGWDWLCPCQSSTGRVWEEQLPYNLAASCSYSEAEDSGWGHSVPPPPSSQRAEMQEAL